MSVICRKCHVSIARVCVIIHSLQVHTIYFNRGENLEEHLRVWNNLSKQEWNLIKILSSHTVYPYYILNAYFYHLQWSWLWQSLVWKFEITFKSLKFEDFTQSKNKCFSILLACFRTLMILAWLKVLCCQHNSSIYLAHCSHVSWKHGSNMLL